MNAACRRRTLATTAAGAAGAGALGLAWHRHRHPLVASAVIVDPAQSTTVDDYGAVHSVQAADLTLPAVRLDEIWDLTHLERIARTYWRFLSRVSLGLIRVVYTPTGRAIVALARPLTLLLFQTPEYEMDAGRGLVRWRIKDGVLVARQGRGGVGYLQIDLRRGTARPDGEVTAHVEVEVAHFYPSIAARLSTAVYKATQSRIHVLVTHRFLHSLARLDLAESRVGRFAAGPPGDALSAAAARSQP